MRRTREEKRKRGGEGKGRRRVRNRRWEGGKRMGGLTSVMGTVRCTFPLRSLEANNAIEP